MATLTQILNAFVEANDLHGLSDFSSGETTFEGLEGHSTLTKKQLMKTPEFAGFSDGYQGIPHRYQGPQGSVDTGVTAAGSIAAAIFSGFDFDEQGPLISESDAEDIIGSFPEERYDQQYTSGSTARK